MTEKKTDKAAHKSKADREDLKKKYEHLLNDYKNIWKASSDEDRKQIFDFANEYKKFIDSAKTEREFVSEAITSATEKGFVDIKSVKALKTVKGLCVNQGRVSFWPSLEKSHCRTASIFLGRTLIRLDWI